MPKLIVCDVEGTIFKAAYKIDGTDYSSTMWQPIAQMLGDAAIEEERASHERWDNKEYNNYLEWVKESIAIHRKYGLKKDGFDRLIQVAEYNTGVREFFHSIDRNKYIPVLISGGFQELIRRAQRELGIQYGLGACEYYFDAHDYLESYTLQPSDYDGKLFFLKMIVNMLNLNLQKDWIFVGDGKNDVDIAKAAPLRFCIAPAEGQEPHEKIRAVPNIIEISSFMEILPYLKQMDSPAPAEEAVNDKTPKRNVRYLSDEERQRKLVVQQEREIRELKQKLNDMKGKTEKKARLCQVPVIEIDYASTPPIALSELLSNLRVVFLGLRKHYAAYRRLESIKGLQVISSEKNNFDSSTIKNADFLFIYKNCISHSAVAHACAEKAPPPSCFLKEHTNDGLLENALANVLYRFTTRGMT